MRHLGSIVNTHAPFTGHGKLYLQVFFAVMLILVLVIVLVLACPVLVNITASFFDDFFGADGAEASTNCCGKTLSCTSASSTSSASSTISSSTSDNEGDPLRIASDLSSSKSYVGQGQSDQATKLFQITPYVNDFQTLNNPGS